MMPVTQRARGGMVTAPHAAAATAGARVLADGGNAIEAALATAAVLTVVYPHMTGLGGDSFWLIAAPGRAPVTIDGAGRAGAGVTPGLYSGQGLHAVPWRGALAANTVAGAVSAWAAAADLSGAWGGRMSLPRLFQEAVTLAYEGTVVTGSHAQAAGTFWAELAAVPGFSALHGIDAAPPAAGQRLRQPGLGRTFERLARDGLDDFYRGALGAQIAAELAAAGTPLSGADLAAQYARLGAPLQVTLPMAEVYNCRPPSQGLASLLILGTFAHLEAPHADTFAHIHGLVESTKLAFAVRDREVGHGDPTRGELERHLAPDALLRSAQRIDPRRAAPWHPGPGDGDTAWFGVIDAAGRAVSAIQSLFFEFGSGVGLPESGFLWQNRGSAFRLAGDGPNVLGPGRQPFHTLNPAYARFRDGRSMVYGAMGGDGQPQTQAAVFTRVAFFGQDLQAAISAPRWVLGRTWRDTVTSLRMESRFPAALLADLASAGHCIDTVSAFDQAMGHAGAIVHHAGGGFDGASDPRSDGAAVGC